MRSPSKQVHPTRSDSHVAELARQGQLNAKIDEFESAMAGLLFLTPQDRLEIRDELQSKKVSGAKCDAQIEYLGTYINLLTVIALFKGETNKRIAREGSEEGVLLIQAKKEFRATYLQAIEKLEDMTKQLLTSHSFNVPKKDLELLERAAYATYHFYHAPLVPSFKNALIDTTKQIYRKMGPFWHGLKTILTNLVGLGCVFIGGLGVIPSLGGSLAMIGVGAALCLSTIPRLTVQGAKTRKHASEVSAAMDKMRIAEKLMTQAKNQPIDAKRAAVGVEKYRELTISLGDDRTSDIEVLPTLTVTRRL